MNRKSNLLALLGAGLLTILVVASFSNAASSVAPKLQSEPTISGSAVVGSTLTATSGSWSGTAPLKYSYQWLRCNATATGCSSIGGANSSTYQVRAADIGHTLRVRVTARNSDGSAQADSNATSVVTAATPAPSATGCPSGNGPVNVTQVSLPARLLIDGQSASPAQVSKSSTQDLTLRFHVSACNGRPVQGALVYAAAVPFNQFSISEVPTGADGWATLTEHRLGGFPASSKQQLLAVFVRARKPGENILAGISARVLVSFPVTR